MKLIVRRPIGRTELVPLISVFGLMFLLSVEVKAIPNGGYARPELLIQPEELKTQIDRKAWDIRVIDIREKIKYLAGHIPGAINIWRPDIVDKNDPLAGMMAPQGQIEEWMGRLGVSNRNTLIIYSDGPDNARLWWILAYYGFPIGQMKLLDGSLEGWKVRGYPVEIIPPKFDPVSFKLSGKTGTTEPMLCTLTDVKGALKDPKKVVLDVRSSKEYLGEETLAGAVRPGRIPGVKWMEWKEVLIKEGTYKGYWKTAEEIRKLLVDIGVTPDKEIYIHCQSGVRSAHSLMTLYLVGYPLEKLHNYDGSWIEWSRSTEPIETGPPIAGSGKK
ncbi:MAG: sulfurtransferase [Thermodesulfobacteriota bacterium]